MAKITIVAIGHISARIPKHSIEKQRVLLDETAQFVNACQGTLQSRIDARFTIPREQIDDACEPWEDLSLRGRELRNFPTQRIEAALEECSHERVVLCM